MYDGSVSLSRPRCMCVAVRRSGSPRLCPVGRRKARLLPPVRVVCRLPPPPERVFSGIRARTAARVHWALVALINPLPRVLSVQNPPPPDKAPNRIIYVPPITSPGRRHHNTVHQALPLRHRHRHPAPLSLLPLLCSPPVGTPGTRRRSKEVTTLDAMFTKKHTRARHRESERERGGSTHTHKWH